MKAICDDLAAETEALREVVRDLSEEQWRLATPADGWDSHDTVANLFQGDSLARLAVDEPGSFQRVKAGLVSGRLDPSKAVGVDVGALTSAELCERFEAEPGV